MKELLRVYRAEAASEGQVPLTGCSLDIREGEIYSLLGGNDSGRQLLTEFLSGRRQLKKGQLYLWDRRLREKRLPADQVLWVDRNRRMTQSLSIEANLRCLGARGPESRGKELQSLLAAWDFPCTAGQQLRSCPDAVQTRLWFVLAFLRHCPLVCLELTGFAYTEEEMEALIRTIRNCRSQGISTVISAEKENGLTACSDRIAWMEEGRIAKVFAGLEEWRTVFSNRAGREEVSAAAGEGKERASGDPAAGPVRTIFLPADSHSCLRKDRSIGWNLMLSLSGLTGTRFGFVRKDMEHFLEAEFRKDYGIDEDAELVQDLTTSEKKLLTMYRAMMTRPDRIILEKPFLFLEEGRTEQASRLIREMEERGCEVILR